MNSSPSSLTAVFTVWARFPTDRIDFITAFTAELLHFDWIRFNSFKIQMVIGLAIVGRIFLSISSAFDRDVGSSKFAAVTPKTTSIFRTRPRIESVR